MPRLGHDRGRPSLILEYPAATSGTARSTAHADARADGNRNHARPCA